MGRSHQRQAGTHRRGPKLLSTGGQEKKSQAGWTLWAWAEVAVHRWNFFMEKPQS